jgi:hypothetical protein
VKKSIFVKKNNYSMKKTILQLLFCIFLQYATGQSNNFFCIIKTHPAAYVVKNFNLGVEIGKGENSGRLTLSAFWTNKMSPSPYSDSDRFSEGQKETFDVGGLTYRIGYKHILIEKNQNLLYFEPQFRYAQTSGIFNNVSGQFDCKIKNTQILGLFGFQMPNKQKTFMVDLYVGVGYMSAAVNNVLKIASTNPNAVPIGTVVSWKNSGMNIYLGTSIGIILGKNTKE